MAKRIGQNLSEASKIIGKDKSYFSVLKHFQEEAFNEMKKLGNGNIVDGYYKYNDIIVDSKSYIEEWFYSEKKSVLFKIVSKFSNAKSDASKIICSRQLVDSILFKNRTHKIQHRLYLKMVEIKNILQDIDDGNTRKNMQ